MSTSDQNHYPVFNGGPNPKPEPSKGLPDIVKALLGVVVFFAGCPFVVVKYKSCKEGRETEANNVLQRQDARCERDHICEGDSQKRIDARKDAAECAAGEKRRNAWIAATTPELSGYSPSSMGMSANGHCGRLLRVREEDCSVGHLVEAYGVKRFMTTARDLGFTRVSCGYDEFPMDSIWRQSDPITPAESPTKSRKKRGAAK